MSNIDFWRKSNDLSLRGMERIANQMLNDFFRGLDVVEKNNTLLPMCDFYETDGSYHLSMELPGILKDDIDVSVSDNILNIKGEKKYENECKDKKKYFYLERSYGSFYRSINLPSDTDKDNITVNFSNGVLEIIIRKSAQSSVKKLSIS